MLDVIHMILKEFGFTPSTTDTGAPDVGRGLKANGITVTAAELGALFSQAAAASSIVTGIIAGTTQTQAGATALTGRVNIIGTCANANDGVKLKTAVKGDVQIVINKGANVAKLYPATSDTLDGGTVNVAVTIPVGGAYICTADGAVNWILQRAPLNIDFGIGTLDGANPTPVSHRLNQIIGAVVQQIGSAAPGLDPHKLTYALSGNTFNVYAWKPTAANDCTLIASTNSTITFFWIALGY